MYVKNKAHVRIYSNHLPVMHLTMNFGRFDFACFTHLLLLFYLNVSYHICSHSLLIYPGPLVRILVSVVTIQCYWRAWKLRKR